MRRFRLPAGPSAGRAEAPFGADRPAVEHLPRDGCVMSVFLGSSLFLSQAPGRSFPSSEPAPTGGF